MRNLLHCTEQNFVGLTFVRKRELYAFKVKFFVNVAEFPFEDRHGHRSVFGKGKYLNGVIVFNDQRERTQARSERENELFQIPQLSGTAQPGGNPDQVL